jgi:hypothetical protein
LNFAVWGELLQRLGRGEAKRGGGPRGCRTAAFDRPSCGWRRTRCNDFVAGRFPALQPLTVGADIRVAQFGQFLRRLDALRARWPPAVGHDLRILRQFRSARPDRIEGHSPRAWDQLAGEEFVRLHVQHVQPAVTVQALLQFRSRQRANVGETDPTGDERTFALSRQARLIPIVATQSVSALRSALPGDESWRTLLQCFRTKLFLATSDEFTARAAADLCGRRDPKVRVAADFLKRIASEPDGLR